MKMAIIYVASFPFICLMFLGAERLTESIPTWKWPSLIMVGITIFALIYILLIRLWDLVYWFSVMMACSFNEYMKERFPLEYTKSPKLNRRLKSPKLNRRLK
jgi:hypothetical protein